MTGAGTSQSPRPRVTTPWNSAEPLWGNDILIRTEKIILQGVVNDRPKGFVADRVIVFLHPPWRWGTLVLPPPYSSTECATPDRSRTKNLAETVNIRYLHIYEPFYIYLTREKHTHPQRADRKGLCSFSVGSWEHQFVPASISQSVEDLLVLFTATKRMFNDDTSRFSGSLCNLCFSGRKTESDNGD